MTGLLINVSYALGAYAFLFVGVILAADGLGSYVELASEPRYLCLCAGGLALLAAGLRARSVEEAQ